ncbi:MAG TPA: phosphoribosylanthranilate isomerase [Sphingomonadaceae bacterium]|nr:phosphoribosylanthranilate isomerase [Sphingomonadaceae bacterium]
MSVRTKICGLSTPETLAAALRHGASHVGFIFFPKSPRNVDPDRAALLARQLPSHVAAVGVFVDPAPDLLAQVLSRVPLQVVQLHGRERPAFAAEVRDIHGVELWKALPIRARADLAAARDYVGAADRILYDAKTPEDADLPGGMGLRFDWKLLDRDTGGFVHPLPWLLSGGLDAGNVAEAVGITGADFVDVSSGVESAPGVKDVDKIAGFLQAVERL